MALDTAVELVPTPLSAAAGAVELERVTRVYGRGDGAVVALDDVYARASRRQLHRRHGPVGLRQEHVPPLRRRPRPPTSGTSGSAASTSAGLDEAKRTELRRERVGFVFQAFNLLPSLTVEQNIGLPLRLAGPRWTARGRARSSSGSGWRAAASTGPPSCPAASSSASRSPARSLTRPEVVFADEPTGALDTRTGGEILDLLRHVVDAFGQTV